jgi:hypothetical protein
MRPGQNKRMRGRNNNNRKSPNPLTRSYESNGPDVKIRGTAHHVAEKYLQLARDAQSSGDPVMAESYLQHAEHYFRLIASAQAAQQQAQMGYQRNGSEAAMDDDDDDDDFGGLPDRFASPPERLSPPPFGGPPPQQSQPVPQQQPYQERQPYNGDRQQQGDRQHQPRNDRNNGQDRPFQDRNNNNQNRFNQNRGPRDNRPQRDFRNDQQQPRIEQPQPRMEQASVAPAPQPDVEPTLPSFITTPVRVAPTVVEQEQPNLPVIGERASEEQPVGGYHLRPRRRRARPDAERPSEQAGSDATSTPGDAPVGE